MKESKRLFAGFAETAEVILVDEKGDVIHSNGQPIVRAGIVMTSRRSLRSTATSSKKFVLTAVL